MAIFVDRDASLSVEDDSSFAIETGQVLNFTFLTLNNCFYSSNCVSLPILFQNFIC